MNNRMRRVSLRAPFREEILYRSDDYILKGFAVNISKGGVLIDGLPLVPSEKIIHLLLKIPSFPELRLVERGVLTSLSPQLFKGEVIRTKVKIVRELQGISTVDQSFLSKIGCQFLDNNSRAIKIIDHYVEVFKKNIIYLLNLLESTGKNSDKVLKQNIIRIMGYDESLKTEITRQKILHDYQSLQDL